MKTSICIVAALASLAIASPTPEVSISMKITGGDVAIPVGIKDVDVTLDDPPPVCWLACFYEQPDCPEGMVCHL